MRGSTHDTFPESHIPVFDNLVTIGSGEGKVVLPRMTSSLVLLRLSFIKLSSAQALCDKYLKKAFLAF